MLRQSGGLRSYRYCPISLPERLAYMTESRPFSEWPTIRSAHRRHVPELKALRPAGWARHSPRRRLDGSYSYLNAAIGSTEDARRAGIKAAKAAVTIRTKVTAVKINGLWTLPSAHFDSTRLE
jgi:hypothetical protein